MHLTRLSISLLLFFILAPFISARAQQDPSASLTAVEIVRLAFAHEEDEPIKCATGALLDWRMAPPPSRATRILQLQRPTLPEEYVTGDGLFRIHFTTTGGDAVDPASTIVTGVPDYVYEVGLAAGYSHRLLIDTLGYRSPASDGGRDGTEFDIYILNLQRGLYGFTDPEELVAGAASRFSAYIVIDNSYGNANDTEGYYTQGLAAMRVTVAHEYFHAVQFNYGYRNEDRYFFETTSVWFEDVAYTEVNDYLGYLSPYFRTLSQPLYQQDGQHEYGNGIWLKYLVKKFDINIVRQIWDGIDEATALESTSEVLNGRNYTLSAAYSEFAVWVYFTGHRADPVSYFPEGANYPLVRFDRKQLALASTSIADSLLNLASRFYRFDSLGQPLTLSHISEAQPGRWRFATITGNQQSVYTVQQSSSGVPLAVSPAGRLDTLVVVVSNSSLPTLQVFFRFSLEISSGGSRSESRLLAPGPNPFLPGSGEDLVLRLTLQSPAEVEVFVLAEDGRRVRHIDRGLRSAGIDEIPWDGRNDDGEIVASGIYIVHVIAGGFQEAAKVAVIHR